MTQNGHHLTVRSPIEGTVLATNDRLSGDPGVLQESPFNDGWAYTIQPIKPARIREFFIGDESKRWISEEFARLKHILSTSGGPLASPVLLQDGGAPIAGLMRMAPDELWDRIDAEFLNVAH